MGLFEEILIRFEEIENIMEEINKNIIQLI